jgi:hypothetical protein
MDDTSLTFPTWLDRLRASGHRVLLAHAVPAQLWLARPDGTVLHLLARGTTVTLRRYDASALATVVLRSECDCESHRTAGAGSRVALVPGAEPIAEAVLDGAAELGWRSVEAALLPVPRLAAVFDLLSAELHGLAGVA